MDELIQLVTFLVVFGAWVLNSVNQAKKRRERELEEMFEGFEEEETASPRPSESRPVRPDPEPAKKTGWEEIQRELRRMLEEEPPAEPLPTPVSQPKTKPAPLPPQPRAEVPQSRPKVSPPRPRGTVPKPPVTTRQRPERTLPTRPHLEAPSVAQRQREVSKQRAREEHFPIQIAEPLKRKVGSLQRGKWGQRSAEGKREDLKVLLNLHPNPIANAIVLGEVLKGPRGPMPLCGGIRRSRSEG